MKRGNAVHTCVHICVYMCVYARIGEVCMKRGYSIAAVKFCVECKEDLCDPCATHHLIQRMSATHRVLEGGERPRGGWALSAGDASFCAEHGGREVQLYCMQCSEVLCTLCTPQHSR